MAADAKAWRKEFDGLTRAFAGAFLFGVPLLYTNEMWWLGSILPEWQLLAFVGLAFVAALALSYVAGFRDGPHHKLSTALQEAIGALAVGAVGSLVVLLVLDRISLDDPLQKIVGLIALQSVPLAMGASLANVLLVARGGAKGSLDGNSTRHGPWTALGVDVGATAAGALFISFNIAPTEEIGMLAAELDVIHLAGLVFLSLVIGYLVVFGSEFTRAEQRRGQQGPFQHPLTETTLSYVVSLVLAVGVLALFGQFTSASTHDAIARTVVLGLPACIGGAAGRLAV